MLFINIHRVDFLSIEKKSLYIQDNSYLFDGKGGRFIIFHYVNINIKMQKVNTSKVL